jgi:superfamily II DNA/RNA helicase
LFYIDLFFPHVDVSDIKFVINVDYPSSSEDYIHRIGRTARSDRHGTAYTFFTHANAKQARDLINVLQEAKQQVSSKLRELVSMAGSFGGRSKFVIRDPYMLAFCRNHAVIVKYTFSI